MPDDDYRPSHGPSPDSRPTNVPPEWWSQLDRGDLPTGGGVPDRGHARVAEGEAEIIRALRGRRGAGPGAGWHRWITSLALTAIAVLLIVLWLGDATLKGIAAVLLLVGIVTLLAVRVSISRANRRGR
jgi:hypothetical protein